MAFLRRKSIGLLFVQLIALAGSQVLAQTELDMETAVDMYVTRNPNLQATREQIEMARGRLNQSGVWPNPTLNYSQEGFPFGDSQASFWEDQEFHFGAGQLFELGGKRGHRQEVARLDLNARELEIEDVLRLGKVRVKRAFLAAHYAQRKRELAEDLFSTYERLRDIHQQRLEAGDVSGLSQLKINGEVLRYLTAVAQAQIDLTQAWNELAALIAWPGLIQPKLELPEGIEAMEKSLKELQQLALQSRSDLAVQRVEVQKNQADIRLQRAQRVPDLTVGGGYKRDFGQNTYFLGLDLPLPLFDRNQGRIAEESANARRMQNLLTWKELQILREVEGAFENFVTHRENVERIQQSVIDQVDQVARITSQSYLEGEASLLDYLDALRVQLDTSMDYYELLHQVKRARVALEMAVGGDLN
jgi:cobalt-zinc-cadmium efflux system outer membrane protein